MTTTPDWSWLPEGARGLADLAHADPAITVHMAHAGLWAVLVDLAAHQAAPAEGPDGEVVFPGAGKLPGTIAAAQKLGESLLATAPKKASKKASPLDELVARRAQRDAASAEAP